MRWDDLFADLEAQADALAAAERAGEIDERTRIEVGALGLGDRLRAAHGAQLQIRVDGGLTITGVLARAGVDWLLIAEDAARETLAALGAVVAVGGLGRTSEAPGSGGAVHARLTLRHALRGVVRDRSAVRMHLRAGDVLDGTLDRVGGDFVDLAQHNAGEVRRRGDVRAVTAVPLAAIAAVRRAS